MRTSNIILGLFTICAVLSSCSGDKAQLYSPDKSICVSVSAGDKGLFYSVRKNGEYLISDSFLGVELKDAPVLGCGLEIVSITGSTRDELWEQTWGEEQYVRDCHNEMLVSLKEKEGLRRKLNLRVRAFDDGIGFRYEFPKQDNIDDFVIMQENTEFNLASDPVSWTIPSPAYGQRYYESLYRKLRVSEIKDTVTTPVTMAFDNGLHMSIHEAGLTDYAKMNLYVTEGSNMKSDLTPWSTGEKVFAKTPFVSPWRTVVISENAAGLLTSRLVLNLNEPCKIDDTDFIKPSKYVGIWWGMHMKEYTWAQGPKHGAKTANVVKYIDFAAENNTPAVLVEGWNEGWNGVWEENGDKFRFAEPFSDFDIEYLSGYARTKGVRIIGHHETAGAVSNYESQFEEAFNFCNRYGITTVKTGYVSPYLDGNELHDSQFGVHHMQKVVETAAKYNVCIVNHEPVMPTGVCRTWPNLLAQEGMRGQEWNAWSDDGGNPASHTVVLPFTRGLAGPMDFTPGIFNFNNIAKPQTKVHTTLAKQLALYVVLYSPVQMAADMIENYAGNPAFQFIRDVAVDWEKTIVLNAEIGEYLTTVRKDRHSDDWFLGSVTNELGREFEISLDFLDEDREYMAEIYEDAPDADFNGNPASFVIRKEKVCNKSILKMKLAQGGGTAVHFIAL